MNRRYAEKSGNLSHPTHLTVRFWTFYRNSWVKLTLREGQEIRFGFSALDSEGFHYEFERYYLEGDTVVSEWRAGGRDCDGSLDRVGSLYCSIHRLKAIKAYASDEYSGAAAKWWEKDWLFNGQRIYRPDWLKSNELIHDQFAEAANY